MSKLLKINKLMLSGLVLAACLASGALAQTEVTAITAWDPPTYGTAVDHYVLQQSINDGAWQDVATVWGTSQTVQLTVGDTHRFRVAAVDAQDRQGPFSLPCNPYTPTGDTTLAPCPPGTPQGEVVLEIP